MLRIGNDQAFGEVYESIGNYFRIILPRPILTGAILDPAFPINFAAADAAGWHMFREEYFDPTTRIRRGRFYIPSPGQRPSPQRVLPRLAGDSIEGNFEKPLFVYDSLWLPANAKSPRLVALGAAGRVSLWQVAALPELISTGELLFVLKARQSFGVVPEIEQSSVPEQGRAKVVEVLEALADAAHRESPGSIIDRARDAAQWCLATWAMSEFSDARLLNEDLGPLLEKLGKKREMVAFKAAEIVRRLHSRVKPHEQEKRSE